MHRSCFDRSDIRCKSGGMTVQMMCLRLFDCYLPSTFSGICQQTQYLVLCREFAKQMLRLKVLLKTTLSAAVPGSTPHISISKLFAANLKNTKSIFFKLCYCCSCLYFTVTVIDLSNICCIQIAVLPFRCTYQILMIFVALGRHA